MAQWVGLLGTMMLILCAVSVSMVHSQSPAMLHQLLGGWMTGGHNWEGQGWYPGHNPHDFPGKLRVTHFPGKLRVASGQQFPGQLVPPQQLKTEALLRDAAEGNPGSLGYFTLGNKPFLVMAPVDAAGILRSEGAEGLDSYSGPGGWIAPIEENDISLSPVEKENWPLIEENPESMFTPLEDMEENLSINKSTNDLTEGSLTFSEPISIDQGN